MLFLTLKALHVISVICWFAVLFYLPRLFVYHAMAEDQIGKDRFKIMERKLLRAIGNPSMIATVVFGIATVATNWAYYSTATWFWIKVVMVIVLLGYHHACARYVKHFAADRPAPSHKFFRFFNEIPVIFLIAIVFLVILKRPF